MLSERHLSRVPALIEGFPRYVAGFSQTPAFDRGGQLSHHVETIRLRRAAGSASAALEDDAFIRSLHNTLRAWGIGVRASRLLEPREFAAALRTRAPLIAEFEPYRISDPSAVESVAGSLWGLIENLGIVDNKTQIVSGTKALHHLLPDLVVPFDRMWTQRFFSWHSPEVQYGQADRFVESLMVFSHVASLAKPETYVGSGWNTSATKVIDNAIIGLLQEEKRASG